MARRVVVYTNDARTKAFLESQARKIDRGFVRRSGARYRLNRWRERQLGRNRKITYGDLVKEYVRLCRSPKAFARVPHGRYINFVSDFREANPQATFAEAVRAWHTVKRLPVPKTYRAWKGARKAEVFLLNGYCPSPPSPSPRQTRARYSFLQVIRGVHEMAPPGIAIAQHRMAGCQCENCVARCCSCSWPRLPRMPRNSGRRKKSRTRSSGSPPAR